MSSTLVLIALAITSAAKLTSAQQKIPRIVFPTQVPILLVWFYSLKEEYKNNVPDKTLKAFLFKVIMISIYVY